MAKERPVSLRISQADACALLAVDRRTFRLNYDQLFTDTRPAHARGPGKPRWVPRDEIEIYVECGETALLDYRRRMGRLRPGR